MKCPLCSIEIAERDAFEHTATCSGENMLQVQCPICGDKFHSDIIGSHAFQCKSKEDVVSSTEKVGIAPNPLSFSTAKVIPDVSQCPLCALYFPLSEIQSHAAECNGASDENARAIPAPAPVANPAASACDSKPEEFPEWHTCTICGVQIFWKETDDHYEEHEKLARAVASHSKAPSGSEVTYAQVAASATSAELEQLKQQNQALRKKIEEQNAKKKRDNDALHRYQHRQQQSVASEDSKTADFSDLGASTIKEVVDAIEEEELEEEWTHIGDLQDPVNQLQ